MKLALVKRKQSSQWKSCQSIVANLIRSYLLTGAKIELFDCDETEDSFQNYQVAVQIKEFVPDKIIFIDHKPHPGSLILMLHKIGIKNTPYIFHLYGDMSLNLKAWHSLLPLLNQSLVKWITASHHQKMLFQNLFEVDESCVSVVPFPVERSVFSFRREKREAFRAEQNLQQTDVAFLYTGRLSVQKNVILLLKSFAELVLQGTNNKLYIAGSIDDIGIPFIGKKGLAGAYAASLSSYFGMENIVFLGDLAAAPLQQVYCGCDYYVSLSGHNDEDYGMAPAEALMCGMPAVLSDWGGFSSFAFYFPDYVKLLKVKFDSIPVAPTAKDIVSVCTFGIHKVLPTEERERLASLADRKLSCEAVADLLKNMISSGLYSSKIAITDDGFAMMRLFENLPENPFAYSGAQANLYRRIYSAYVQEIKQ